MKKVQRKNFKERYKKGNSLSENKPQNSQRRHEIHEETFQMQDKS